MEQISEKTRRAMRARATGSATRIMRMTDSTQKQAALREHFDRFGDSARTRFGPAACTVRR